MSPRYPGWPPGRRWPAAALFALVGSALGAGAWTGFPVFSDAIVPLLIHETGAASVARRHGDRPVYGWMLQATVSAFGLHRLAWIVISLACWGLFAWVTARFFRRLFPERAQWSWLPALLVLSPIVVQTQYVTLTIAYPDVIPVTLVLGALLSGMGRSGWRRALAVVLLGGLASTISEYGVAAGFAGVALAFLLRERLAALWLAAGVGFGALVFRLTTDPSARPDVTADALLPKLAAAPIAALYQWLLGVWHATIGAYGGAIWHAQLDAKSRSSVAFAAMGVFGAILAAIAGSRAAKAEAPVADTRALARFPVLLVAVAAAVLPVVAAGRPTYFSAAWTGEYETRFLLPALPFAGVFLAGAVAVGFTPSMAPFAAALLAFLCVEASWEGARQAALTERWAEQLGRALLPIVRSNGGINLAIGPDDPKKRWGSMLTGKMTAAWPDAESRRVWAMARSSAARLFGDREGCRTPENINISGETRWGGRTGRLSSMVWVPDNGDRVGPFEPYCPGLRPP
jgi:hypothetical protein